MVNFATKERWCELMACAQLPECSQAYEKLVTAYSKPQRHYHTLKHIDDMLGEFVLAKEQINGDLVAIELAIWFHDAVYKPMSKTNEYDSARWAKEFLGGYGRSDLAQEVFDLVMATKDHHPINHNAKWLLDIDLSILGAKPERFELFEQQVRKEYRWVPNIIYKSKRKEILKQFLQRPEIYQTEYFRERYEMQARINIEGSID